MEISNLALQDRLLLLAFLLRVAAHPQPLQHVVEPLQRARQLIQGQRRDFARGRQLSARLRFRPRGLGLRLLQAHLRFLHARRLATLQQRIAGLDIGGRRVRPLLRNNLPCRLLIQEPLLRRELMRPPPVQLGNFAFPGEHGAIISWPLRRELLHKLQIHAIRLGIVNGDALVATLNPLARQTELDLEDCRVAVGLFPGPLHLLEGIADPLRRQSLALLALDANGDLKRRHPQCRVHGVPGVGRKRRRHAGEFRIVFLRLEPHLGEVVHGLVALLEPRRPL